MWWAHGPSAKTAKTGKSHLFIQGSRHSPLHAWSQVRWQLVPREDDSTVYYIVHSKFSWPLGWSPVLSDLIKKEFIFLIFRTGDNFAMEPGAAHKVGLLPSHREWEMGVRPPLDANIPRTWFSGPWERTNWVIKLVEPYLAVKQFTCISKRREKIYNYKFSKEKYSKGR